MNTYPSCFNSQSEYDEWRAVARLAPPPPNHGYCTDCTPEYKAKMLAEKRCAFPSAAFVTDPLEPGWIEGRRSSEEVHFLRVSRKAA